MFKRRLAVLGAVAVLAITGMAGSALADEPAPVAGSKVTCTTSDGKVVELSRALPAAPLPEGAEGAIKIKRLEDGEGVQIEKVTPEELEKVTPGEFKKVAPREFAEAVPAVPARPAESAVPESAVPARPDQLAGVAELVEPAQGATVPGEKLAKTVKVICKKAE